MLRAPALDQLALRLRPLSDGQIRYALRLGARAIYTTNLHELASNLEQLNAETPGDSDVVSMVALVAPDGAVEAGEGGERFRIALRPPVGRSYAEQIAARYGIAQEQLVELLQRRGALPAAEASQLDA